MRFRHLLGILALIITPIAGIAQSRPFGNGEQLTYAVCYRAKLVPKTAVGKATLDCQTIEHNNKLHYRIVANGRTLPFFRWFFDLNDTYTSLIDSTTMLPTSLNIALREEKYTFDADFAYDWKHKQVNTVYKKGSWKEARTKNIALEYNHLDPVALFYNLRNMDPQTCQVGDPTDLYMVLEDTVRIITYTYLGKDTIKLKNIGHVPSHKFTCTIATSGVETFKDGTNFYLWISDDENRIPLWIESPIRVGSVLAYLTDYKNLRTKLRTIPK